MTERHRKIKIEVPDRRGRPRNKELTYTLLDSIYPYAIGNELSEA